MIPIQTPDTGIRFTIAPKRDPDFWNPPPFLQTPHMCQPGDSTDFRKKVRNVKRWVLSKDPTFREIGPRNRGCLGLGLRVGGVWGYG